MLGTAHARTSLSTHRAMPEASRVALAASGLAVTAAGCWAIYELRRQRRRQTVRESAAPAAATVALDVSAPAAGPTALEAEPSTPDWVPSGAITLAADEATSQTSAPLTHTLLKDTLDCSITAAYERMESPQFVLDLKANDGARDIRLSEWKEGAQSKWRSCTFFCTNPEGRMHEAQRVERLPSGEVVVHNVVATADVLAAVGGGDV